jgi:hypothetical protein
MNNLIINKVREGNEVFPYIEMNVETGVCIISGNSYMQNARLFFQPVIDWLNNYTSTRKGDLLLIYDIENLNTGTSRVLFEILETLQLYKKIGGKVKINWHHNDKTDTHIDDILDFTSSIGIDIDIITV